MITPCRPIASTAFFSTFTSACSIWARSIRIAPIGARTSHCQAMARSSSCGRMSAAIPSSTSRTSQGVFVGAGSLMTSAKLRHRRDLLDFGHDGARGRHRRFHDADIDQRRAHAAAADRGAQPTRRPRDDGRAQTDRNDARDQRFTRRVRTNVGSSGRSNTLLFSNAGAAQMRALPRIPARIVRGRARGVRK